MVRHAWSGGRWTISAVARVMRPGVKADHMLILEGPQGAKKSTALKVLASEDWFTDELDEIGTKVAAQQMQGVWIVEIAELDAISRVKVSRIKAFLTRTTDRYCPPYGRHIVEVPRQCAFAGRVNPETNLRDETGDRRFWPIRCGGIDVEALHCDRDQVWAEAVHQFRQGAIWWLDNPGLIQRAEHEQRARYTDDAWDARIERWLTHERRSVNYGFARFEEWREQEIVRDVALNDVSAGEILEGALGIEPARWTRNEQMRVTAYLKARGWERCQARWARDGRLHASGGAGTNSANILSSTG
jgi:putative DNA primase/helicase